MGGSQLPSELNLSNSNDLHLTTNTVTSSWLVKYSADLFATHLIKLSHTGETTNLAQSLGIYNTHVDESTNSLFIMGTLKWAANPQYTEGYVLYNGDTVNVDNKSAYWIRLNKDNLALISFGKARSNEETYGITALATSHNRVFSQIKYIGSINFDDTTCVVDNHGMAFAIWDNEGHELEIIDYGNVASQDYAGQINVVDSIVYLTGKISNGQCFGSSTETWEGSQPYISKYVDISFLTPYTPIDTTHTDPIDTGSVRITVVGDEGAFVAYPNPFRQKVTIEVQGGEPLAETAWLTDLTGRREQVRLTAEAPGRYTLDLTARPQATYLLTLTTASGKTHTVRLLKQSDIFSR